MPAHLRPSGRFGSHDGRARRAGGAFGDVREFPCCSAPADGDAAARPALARPAPARRRRLRAGRRQERGLERHRAGAHDRPGQPGDIDPRHPPGRGRLPREAHQPAAPQGPALAPDRALAIACRVRRGRGALARDRALWPARRPLAGNAARVPADLARGAHRGHRVHPRRERHRQGTGGARGARHEPPARAAVPCGELRRAVAQPDRKRNLRPRVRQLHRRRTPAPGLLRTRARRHAVPGRGDRDAAGAAGEAAAGAGDRHLHARGLHAGAADRCARDRGNQPRCGRGGGERPHARRPALPAQRIPHRLAAAARARRAARHAVCPMHECRIHTGTDRARGHPPTSRSRP